MDNKEVFNTINEIRNMMEKSSKILTLSGISAIFVGVYACIAAAVAYYIIGGTCCFFGEIPALHLSRPDKLWLLALIAVFLIILCLATVFLFSYRKAKRNNKRFVFDLTARRLLWYFFLPLVVGGVLCLVFIMQGNYEPIVAFMLIFYGTALINVSGYTYSNTRYLGYAEILLGFVNCFMEAHHLLCWTLGFGVFHIIYGILFYLKYDRRKADNT